MQRGFDIPREQIESGHEAEEARLQREERANAKGVKCDHAWILNIKPTVCMWCGERRKTRSR